MSDPSSPYEPPRVPETEQAGYGVPTTARPVSVTIFGILNLVFAGLGLFGLCFGMVPLLLMQNSTLPNPVIELMRANQAYFTFTIISMGLGVIATAVLGIAGIGLLRMKAWGRHLSIGYAVYAIVAAVGGMIANWIWLVGPLLEQADQMGGGPEKAGAIGGAIGGMFGGCFGLIYPVLLLIFMLRPTMARAFQSQRSPDRTLL